MFQPTVNLTITCDQLRHKMMYIDERQKTFGRADDGSDTRIYWCTQTQDSRGPDGQPVMPKACQPGRTCYCHET